MNLNNNHSFNIDLAKTVGIEKALLLGRIWLFVEYHRQNLTNFREGRYWMYDSARSFAEVYPYLSEGSIRRWLIELEKEEWIESGNYNRKNNDLTKWYTFGKRFIEWLKENDLAIQNERGTSGIEQTAVQNEWEEQGDMFAIQNERENLPKEQTAIQNERPVIQNERSIIQNERPLPFITTNITSCSSSRKEPTTAAIQNERVTSGIKQSAIQNEWPNLQEKVNQFFRHWFNRLDPHPVADVDAIVKAINGHSDKIDFEKLIAITNRAFERVVQEKNKKDWLTKEVLLRIKWGVEDYYKNKEKTDAKEKAEDIARIAAGNKPEKKNGSKLEFLNGLIKGYEEAKANGQRIDEKHYQKCIRERSAILQMKAIINTRTKQETLTTLPGIEN